jgi:hypothetical protein
VALTKEIDLMERKSKSKALEAIEELRRQYPTETVEELFERFNKLVQSDENLKDAVLKEQFEMLCDELYDEAAREGRSIPNVLRKPS